MATTTTSMARVRRFAIVVGVANYTSEHLTALPFSRRDATRLEQVLTALCGYRREEVALLLDPSRDELLASLDRLGQSTESPSDEESAVLLYFSGHGYRPPEDGAASATAAVDRDAYLCLSDTDLAQPERTAVSGRALRDLLRGIRSRKVLVVLDCCHAAGLGMAKTGGERGRDAAVDSGLPQLAEQVLGSGTGRAIISSCRAEESSYGEADGNLSLFTKHLLDGLQGGRTNTYECADPDGYVRLFALFRYVQAAVCRDNAMQHPSLRSDVEEDFAIAFCNRPDLTLLDKVTKAVWYLPDDKDAVVRFAQEVVASKDWAAQLQLVELVAGVFPSDSVLLRHRAEWFCCWILANGGDVWTRFLRVDWREKMLLVSNLALILARDPAVFQQLPDDSKAAVLRKLRSERQWEAYTDAVLSTSASLSGNDAETLRDMKARLACVPLGVAAARRLPLGWWIDKLEAGLTSWSFDTQNDAADILSRLGPVQVAQLSELEQRSLGRALVDAAICNAWSASRLVIRIAKPAAVGPGDVTVIDWPVPLLQGMMAECLFDQEEHTLVAFPGAARRLGGTSCGSLVGRRGLCGAVLGIPDRLADEDEELLWSWLCAELRQCHSSSDDALFATLVRPALGGLPNSRRMLEPLLGPSPASSSNKRLRPTQ